MKSKMSRSSWLGLELDFRVRGRLRVRVRVRIGVRDLGEALAAGERALRTHAEAVRARGLEGGDLG